MPITLQPQTETKLRERAERDGQDMDTFVNHLLDSISEWEARDQVEAVKGNEYGLDALLPRRAGSAQGRITIADDFDEPLEEFKEYMN